jgi:DNA-binding XRE family transcriptional regulator
MTKEEFRQMRLDIRMSQSELAATLFLHPITISKIERGVSKPFNLRRRLEQLMWNGTLAEQALGFLNKKEGE